MASTLPTAVVPSEQTSTEPTGEVMVVGAAARCDSLSAKTLFRPAGKIAALMPFGSAGLKLKVPKRKDFGEEGEEGDAAHEAAMQKFSLAEFGSSHVEKRAARGVPSH